MSLIKEIVYFCNIVDVMSYIKEYYPNTLHFYCIHMYFPLSSEAETKQHF